MYVYELCSQALTLRVSPTTDGSRHSELQHRVLLFFPFFVFFVFVFVFPIRCGGEGDGAGSDA